MIAAAVTSAAEFILEGLWAQKRINRSEERGYFADARKTPEPRDPREPSGRVGRGDNSIDDATTIVILREQRDRRIWIKQDFAGKHINHVTEGLV